MSVKVSGSVLSSLFFEHNTSESDQEGFLLGQIQSHVTDIVTDSQISGIKEETITYVHSFVPCSGLFNWYDNIGQIVTSKIKAILNDNKSKEVVGWYKFRRNSPADCVSLREQCIHQNLLDSLPGIVPQNFLLFLCTGTTTSNQSTHSFDHTFLSYNGRSFKGVPVSIVNLGDAPQSQYRHHPSNAINNERGRFAQTVKSFQDQFCDQSGRMHSVAGVQTFNSVIHHQLVDLCETVATSEKQLEELYAEVSELERQLKRKQQPIASTKQQNIVSDNKKSQSPSPSESILFFPDSSKTATTSSTISTSKTKNEATVSSSAIKDLIVLEDSDISCDSDFENKKTTKGTIKQVGTVNPIPMETAPSVVNRMPSPKLAANFDALKQTAMSTDVRPKQSAKEPVKSKTMPKKQSDSQNVSKKTQKADSFSFVDDLLTEHKTIPRASKTKTINNVKESSVRDGITKSEGSKMGTRSKATKQTVEQSGPSGPSTTMEIDLSDSPTF